MARRSKAAVLRGPRQIEVTALDLPAIGPDDGLVRVEICGVCGADWAPYVGQKYDFFHLPVVLGHEIVGRVEGIGERASQRLGVRAGDRVVFEEPIPCGACDACCAGRYQTCRARKRYGSESIDTVPGLWGGYSEYVFLDPRALVHPMSRDVPLAVAPLFVPISNGIEWVQEIGGARTGSTVVIQGPGQHGLGCVIGAREAGAGCIIVLGLARDAARLALARELGAHHTICVDEENAIERVSAITGGRLADTVVDVTEGAPTALALALELAGQRATIVSAGTAHRPAEGFWSDRLMQKELTIRGVNGRYRRAIRAAIGVIEAGKYPLEKLCTHLFAIEETEQALQTLGGEHGPGAIHISVVNR